MQNLEFKLKEVDTEGVKVFELLLVANDIKLAEKAAKVILRNTQSEETKRYVKRRFSEYLSEKFNFILGESQDSLDGAHAKFLNLYFNRAYKKLNISTDIPAFSEIATKYINEGVTLLHYDRLYTLFQAVTNALEVGGDIVELGVYRGGSLKFIAEISGRREGFNLIGFDTFKGHVGVAGQDGRVHVDGMFKGGGIKEVEAYLADPGIRLIEGDVSATFPEYAKKSPRIALAHLDMDIYQPTADALPLAFELLAPGGIILLDDYGFTSCPGVKQAADDFLKQVSATSFHLMTGQMIIVK